MGRPSAAKEQRQLAGVLRLELQRHIERGQCAYCRAPARPNKPLTREHVIPRARGGRRKDVRIIVPACALCNHTRGCQDLIPFLLRRPDRISSFLDYLCTLTPESVRQLDPRVFAELYTAVAILNECAPYGPLWQTEAERLCTGRPLHRRRYAARRAVCLVSARLESIRGRHESLPGPTCIVPMRRADVLPLHLEEPLERVGSRLLSVLALAWRISADVVEKEMTRALAGSAVGSDSLIDPEGTGEDDDAVLPLDGWDTRDRRRRTRVDRRQGRPMRQQRVPSARGRAA